MCKVWQKITFIKNEPYYGPTKLAEGKGHRFEIKFFIIGHIYEVKINGIT